MVVKSRKQSTVNQSMSIRGIDNHKEQYVMMCCGSSSIWGATVAIAFLELAALAVGLIVLSIGFSQQRHEGICYYVGAMVAAPIYMGAACLMLWGAAKELSHWLLPHLALQVLTIFALLIGSVSIISGVNLGTKCKFSDSASAYIRFYESPMNLATIAFFTIFGFLQLWFFIVLIQCYFYLRSNRQVYTGAESEIMLQQNHADSIVMPDEEEMSQ